MVIRIVVTPELRVLVRQTRNGWEVERDYPEDPREPMEVLEIFDNVSDAMAYARQYVSDFMDSYWSSADNVPAYVTALLGGR